MKTKRVLAVVSSIALIIALIFSGIITVLTNRDFYINRFKEDKTVEAIGIQQTELYKIADDFIFFISGKTENLKQTYTINNSETQFFTNSERMYLIELRDAIQTFKLIAEASAAIFALSLFILIILSKKQTFIIFGKAFFWTIAAFVLILAIIGIIASFNVNAFRIFIDNLIFSSAEFGSDTVIAKLFPLLFFGWVIKRVYIMMFIYLLAALGIVYSLYKISLPRKDDDDDYLYQ